MAKRKKLKENLCSEDEEEEAEEEKLKSVAATTSDDDDEANEDFSLKIVEKHLLMRAAKLFQDDDDNINDVFLIDGNKNNGVVVACPSGITDDVIIEDVKSGKKKIRVRKKKKEVEKMEIGGDQSVTVAKEEQKVEAVDNGDEAVKAVEISDNSVMRKLLRGPRYFDPPDSGWQTCYNCGEEGHRAVNCKSAVKRKKPCFKCGSLEHGARQCPKSQDCFICQKGGHHAKDCPDKHSRNAQVCLKCGDSGHEMFSCRNSYSLDDLKEAQCYICKNFGHLCCVNVSDETPRQVSCFRCGRLGHTGLACATSRGETAEASPRSCFKCGGDGHFARECVSSAKVRKRNIGTSTPTLRPHRENYDYSGVKSASRGETAEASPSSCFKCGGDGHFARECVSSAKVRKRNIGTSTPTLRPHRENYDYSGVKSAPHDLGKVQKKRKTQHEEKGMTTPRKSKQRGGWITDYPGDISYGNPQMNHWRSPGTLFYEGQNFGYNF